MTSLAGHGRKRRADRRAGVDCLFGIAAGPMYPLLILTTIDRTTPTSVERLVAAQSAASAVGAATLPALFGSP